MTGSSNDECEGRQQVDRRVGYCNSFLPFYHSVSPHNNILLVLKGLRNMEIFSVSFQPLSFHPPFVCARLCSTQLFHFIRF